MMHNEWKSFLLERHSFVNSLRKRSKTLNPRISNLLNSLFLTHLINNLHQLRQSRHVSSREQMVRDMHVQSSKQIIRKETLYPRISIRSTVYRMLSKIFNSLGAFSPSLSNSMPAEQNSVKNQPVKCI